MVLICLLFHRFLDNLTAENFPSHVILVSKKDILNIEEIDFSSFVRRAKLTLDASIDLSKLEILRRIS